MINFFVKSRADIEGGFFPGGVAVLISISDFGSEMPVCSGQYSDQAGFNFDDADVQIHPSTQLITQVDSQNIVDFIIDSIKGGCDTVVVNCEAGMSRSAGCAAALSLIHNGSDKEIIKTKPLYNRKVYREVLAAHYWDSVVNK